MGMRNKREFLSSAAVFIAVFTSMFFVFSCSQKEISYNRENDKFIEAISPECIERVSPILFCIISHNCAAFKVFKSNVDKS